VYVDWGFHPPFRLQFSRPFRHHSSIAASKSLVDWLSTLNLAFVLWRCFMMTLLKNNECEKKMAGGGRSHLPQVTEVTRSQLAPFPGILLTYIFVTLRIAAPI
jgi:hypothetical protein